MGKTSRISQFSVILIMVALSVTGIASLRRLNIQYKPSTEGEVITVSYHMRDASAETVEAEATSMIEGVLSGIGGCRGVRSVSRKGGGYVTLTFDKGTDMEAARFEVASAIRNLWGHLPDGLTYPEVSRGGGGRSTTALVYLVKSSLPSQEIKRYADDHIVTALASVEGVDGVTVSGATPFEWEIVYDAHKAASAGISSSDIATAFEDYYADQVAGMADGEEGTLVVRLAGAGLSDFGAIPVKNNEGRIVHLRDIATWRYRESLPASYFRINGLNTVNLAVNVSSDANLISSVKAVRAEMLRLQESFPSEITVSIAYDSSEYVRDELDKIYLRTGLCLLILLFFVLVVSRSTRYMVITVITLTVNVLSAIVLYAISGLTVHIYTLAGITVSLGIVIDTSIVMIDHYRHFSDRKAFGSLVSAVGTTVAAILLLFLLPAEERLNLTDFVSVIVINLSLSLVVSYLFIPALMDYMPFRPESRKVVTGFRRLAARHNRWYSRYIAWGVNHRWVYILVAVCAFGIPVCVLPEDSKVREWNSWRDVEKVASSSFGAFYRSLDRSDFYREPAREVLTIQAGMLEGCTVHQLNDVVREMENYLAGFDEIETFRTEVRDYNDASITVEFKPEYEGTGFPSRLKALVTSMAINFGGANWRVFGVDDNYFSNHIVTYNKSHHIMLYGYNFHELMRYAEVLIEYLSRHRRVSGPEIWGGEWGRPASEFNMEYDFEKMVASGVDPYRYYGEVSSLLYDHEIGTVMHEGQLTSVKLRSSDRETYDLWHVLNSPVSVDSLDMTLSGVGSITKKATGIDIIKSDQSYEISVQFDFIGSYELAKKMIGEAVDYMNDEVLAVGYRAETPDYSWFEENKEKYAWLILLIVAVIYVMLSMAFESVRYPFAVILMIPVSFVGVFLTFGLSDLSFDQGGFAAFVMLCGIVVNAGIYLIHSYMDIYQSRRSLTDLSQTNLSQMNLHSTDLQVRSYMKAFNRKINPIMLTVASTVLGLIPFLTDGPKEVFWFDFAIGTISGLAFSLVAVYFYLPVFVVRKNKSRQKE